MDTNQSAEEHNIKRNASSAAHALKVADDREKERLRGEAKNRKKAEKAKAEKAEDDFRNEQAEDLLFDDPFAALDEI